MTHTVDLLKKFVAYSKLLTGDEKGEAQVFCDRLFKAFGHEGYKEAGAILEYRVTSKSNPTRFADLLWGDRLLLEMKKRGSKLESHRTQALDYWWKLRPKSPQYVILCNFDQFLIYDFSKQDEPLDRIEITEIPERFTALNFLFPVPKQPIFNNNLVDVTRVAADKVAKVFNHIISRGEDRERAQRFILQCIFSLFAEDVGLLPRGFFTEIIVECLKGGSSFDLIGGMFKQMASPSPARGGRFKQIEYFNGGLFRIVDPIDLSMDELTLLREASDENWRKVHPAIFGTIFQSSMDKGERHALGAHFTYEVDIYKVVYPTIIDPWRIKIEKAKTLTELEALRKEILEVKILDPACGSGNFMYIAFRELKRLELDILNKIHRNFGIKAARKVGATSLISPTQLFGFDVNHFAVELAKVTLMLAKELSIKEAREMVETKQLDLALELEAPLPLDNLDNNIVCADALFIDWPAVDVIIGNPPYQSKNKIKKELGSGYVNKLRNAYPEIPGRADYCAYWFFKAHRVLPKDGFAGLVGTNTIRQNYTREGSLDYIVKEGGVIFNAVSSQEWPGEAVVFVSIVCWMKGEYKGKKLLYIEDEEGIMQEYQVERINSSLSLNLDVTTAKVLKSNKMPKRVFQGQTHGHQGFLLNTNIARNLIKKNSRLSQVLKPYLIGDELISSYLSQPSRFVIDFTTIDINKASTFKEIFGIVSERVLPDRKKKAEEQVRENDSLLRNDSKAKINKHHINFNNKWWVLSYGREEMVNSIEKLSRYITCSRVAKRPIFEFVSSSIRPNDALMVFAFEDDYSFGIIQSDIHVLWYQEKCSTLKGDPRYTTESIWDTFPWPQKPTKAKIEKVAEAAKKLRDERNRIMMEHNLCLRDLYKLLEKPGKNLIKDLHQKLNESVLEIYGFNRRKNLLGQLLDLNLLIADSEENGMEVVPPGLPHFVKDTDRFVSKDCIKYLNE